MEEEDKRRAVKEEGCAGLFLSVGGLRSSRRREDLEAMSCSANV